MRRPVLKPLRAASEVASLITAKDYPTRAKRASLPEIHLPFVTHSTPLSVTWAAAGVEQKISLGTNAYAHHGAGMVRSSSQSFLKELDKILWTAADRLRVNLDAAVYKHAVLGLISLKYVSDSFAVRQAEIEAQLRDLQSDYFH